jgi:exosortase family protein XrtF
VRKFLLNPLFRFLTIAGLLLLSWNFVYDLYLKPHTQIDRVVVDNLIDISGFFLKAMGYELMPAPPAAQQIRTIGIDGTSGVWIGDPCNGIILFALFLVFMIAYPGSWRKKLWYIPLGLVIIHLVNVIRIVALTIIVSIDYNWLEFNHNYTFYIFVYGAVFALWYIWAFKLSGTGLTSKQSNELAG